MPTREEGSRDSRIFRTFVEVWTDNPGNYGIALVTVFGQRNCSNLLYLIQLSAWVRVLNFVTRILALANIHSVRQQWDQICGNAQSFMVFSLKVCFPSL